ncbi:hypothetical protein K469DRAFT_564434, partial [Zopfia rhizophila CBS 207.26]
YFREDHHPSNGIKSDYNVAYKYKYENWIVLLEHPLQLPGVNPIKGVWLILK